MVKLSSNQALMTYKYLIAKICAKNAWVNQPRDQNDEMSLLIKLFPGADEMVTYMLYISSMLMNANIIRTSLAENQE